MKRLFFYLWNFWPPFFGAGIKIDSLSEDLMYVRVRLKRRPWTRNFVGTQYGGSMYSMTDPIYMVMLINQLGKGFIVWDKSASIRFRKPGKTDLIAEFRLTSEDLQSIRQRLASESKIDWERDVEIKNASGEVVAEVHKVIHIKRKG